MLVLYKICKIFTHNIFTTYVNNTPVMPRKNDDDGRKCHGYGGDNTSSGDNTMIRIDKLY